MLDYDGEEKRLREFEEDGLNMQLAEPFRPDASPDEFSRIVIRQGRYRVLQIQWSKSGDFTLVFFEPGDWEWTLRDWPSTNSI